MRMRWEFFVIPSLAPRIASAEPVFTLEPRTEVLWADETIERDSDDDTFLVGAGLLGGGGWAVYFGAVQLVTELLIGGVGYGNVRESGALEVLLSSRLAYPIGEVFEISVLARAGYALTAIQGDLSNTYASNLGIMWDGRIPKVLPNQNRLSLGVSSGLQAQVGPIAVLGFWVGVQIGFWMGERKSGF